MSNVLTRRASVHQVYVATSMRLIDFFEMTDIEIISEKCSNSRFLFELQCFELELL